MNQYNMTYNNEIVIDGMRYKERELAQLIRRRMLAKEFKNVKKYSRKEKHMKKIFIGIIALFVLSSCESPEYKYYEDGRKVEIINSTNYITDNIKYIEFDGHEYIWYSTGHRGSICHSPKCSCLDKYKK